MKDSSIIISKSCEPITHPKKFTEFAIGDFGKIAFRKRHKQGNGFFKGAGIGMAIGAIYGFATGDHNSRRYPAKLKALAYSIVFGFPYGGLIGFGVGSKKEYVYFEEGQASYIEQKMGLEKYLLKYNDDRLSIE